MAQFTFVVQNSLSLLVLVKGIRVFLFHFVHDVKSMWCLERVTEQLKATRQAKVVCSSAVMTSSTAE